MFDLLYLHQTISRQDYPGYCFRWAEHPTISRIAYNYLYLFISQILYTLLHITIIYK